MRLIIFEDKNVLYLEPITLSRPMFDIRFGKETLLSRFEKINHQNRISLWVRSELKSLTRERFPDYKVNQLLNEDALWLNSRVLWKKNQIEQIISKPSKRYTKQNTLLAAFLNPKEVRDWLRNSNPYDVTKFPNVEEGRELNVKIFDYLWDILDFIPFSIDEIKKKSISIVNYDKVHIDKSSGPVFIENSALVEPFTILRGPVYIGHNVIIKSHSSITNSVIGPGCKVAGEVSNSIFQSNTNKAHYGYIGNSFIGEWVNLGAGTTTSNLKNNYKNISVMINGKLIRSGKLFLGSLIGDHTKTGISTKMNTGTKIGIGCNIVSSQFPSRNVSSFTEILNNKPVKMDFKKFVKTAEIVKLRRNGFFTEQEKKYFNYIYKNL